jgi:hypothetical protein
MLNACVRDQWIAPTIHSSFPQCWFSDVLGGGTRFACAKRRPVRPMNNVPFWQERSIDRESARRTRADALSTSASRSMDCSCDSNAILCGVTGFNTAIHPRAEPMNNVLSWQERSIDRETARRTRADAHSTSASRSMDGSCNSRAISTRSLNGRCADEKKPAGLVSTKGMQAVSSVAERAGFEPALGFHLNTLSRRAT